MKKFILLLFISQALFSSLRAQSLNLAFDSSKTHFVSGPGKHLMAYKPYQLPDSMSYDEFLKLQRNLNWQRIIGAAIVPGYIHFYAGHQRLGWAIAGVRTVGLILSGYAMIDQAGHVDRFSLNFFNIADSLSSLKKRSERNFILLIGGFVLNFMGYAFDWGHGDFIIESERNTVLYKYGSGKAPKPLGGLWIDSRRKILGLAIRWLM